MIGVTATGSLPGDDFRGALNAMREALPEMLPLPELPERGVGSAMIGHALGLIDGLSFDLQRAGWRLTANSDREHRRAQSQWRHDLDDAEELLLGFDGVLKVAVAGPWTLAASVERPAGDRLLADHGARREMAEALAEGVVTLRAELGKRVPGARLRLQVDEPALVAVADGAVPTASGFSRHRVVQPPELAEALRLVRGASGDGTVLHCCAPGSWLDIARRAGFDAASVDAALVDLDELAQWRDEGRGLILGVVDSATPLVQSVDDLVRAALTPLRQIQMDTVDDLLLGTSCGLAGWELRDVVPQLEALRRAADLVGEALAHG